MQRPHASLPFAPLARGIGRWALVVAVLAGALAGCGSTPTRGAARSSDPASQQPRQGESGVTVFGDIDVNVTRERTR